MLSQTRWGFICLLSLLAGPVWADSPLLSANFSAAYRDVPAVARAEEAGLDAETLRSLSEPKLASDVATALAQAAALSAPPQAAGKFLHYLEQTKGKAANELGLEDLSERELFLYGYLLALNPYRPLSGPESTRLAESFALPLLEAAARKAPQDFTYALIVALTRGNEALSKDFCQVWKEVDGVLKRGLKVNLRKQALDGIITYVSLYRQDCREQEARGAALKLKPLRVIESLGAVGLDFDGEGRIAVASNRDTVVRVFSSQDGALVQKLDPGQFADRPRWLGNGEWLAFGDFLPSLHLYETHNWGELPAIVQIPERATALAQVPGKSPLLAVGLFNGQVLLLDLESGQQALSFQAHEKYVSSIVPQADGTLLTASFDATVALFSAKGELLRRGSCLAGCFARGAGQGKAVVYDYGDHWTLLDVASGKNAFSPVSLPSTLHELAVHPTRPLVAAALSSGVVALYDRDSGKPLGQILAHEEPVLSVAFSLDGELMATGSSDGTLRLWKVDSLLASP